MGETLAWLRTSPARCQKVIEEIGVGSEPSVSFYALVATSTLIASFGLIANSTAVIIGAMLVAPLMTPIFGMALALVRGDPGMLGRAVRAELVGVILAVGIAMVFGLLPLAVEVTPEMLARTQPNLLDLLVAVLAGFAGAYALIDERLSPALPGVAISTAVVPPLANTGLCLALAAYQGAYGSFLLFLANFLSILLVSSATFIGAGLTKQIPWAEKWEFARRFGVAGLGFLLVAGILTHALVRIVKTRYLTSSIKQIISSELSQLPTTAMFRMIHHLRGGKLYILATVRTPRVIPPDRVKIIRETLTNQLGWPTELIVRCVLTKDISATGSTSEVTAENLDGAFLTTKVAPGVWRVQVAEQALREKLEARPELDLLEVDLLQFPRGPEILATFQGPRVLIPEEIQELEKAMQDRLGDASVHLLARCLTTSEVDTRGRILYGWSHFGTPSVVEKDLAQAIDAAVKQEFNRFPDLFLTNVDAAPRDDAWAVRVEAVGARVISAKEVARMENTVSRKVSQAVKIYLWSRAEAMVTREGYSSLEEYTRQRLQNQEEACRPKALLTAAVGEGDGGTGGALAPAPGLAAESHPGRGFRAP